MLKFNAFIIILAITAVSAVLFAGFRFSEAQTVSYDIGGWIWSDNYGWISLSSTNTPVSAISYGVRINGNDISGYGWSENVGWVCFGMTCTSTDPSGEKPSSLMLSSSTAKFDGWAQILSLGNDGWIKVGRGNTIGGFPAKDPPMCYDCTAHCDDFDASGTKCILFSSTTFDYCRTCFQRTLFDGENLPDTAVESAAGGSGNIINNCGTGTNGDCKKITSGNASRIECKKNSCGSGTGEVFGVNQDKSNGALLGWAWNGNSGVSSSTGAGWVNFNPPLSQAFIVYPWIQTTQGSIYTPGTVRQKSGSISSNATYCIYASDIQNVSSGQCKSRPVAGIDINLPTQGESQTKIYENALGKIDIQGLITPVKGNYNKYGQEVVSTTVHDADSLSIIPYTNIGGKKEILLGNKVYYFKNGMEHVTASVIKNATTSSGRGNGLIIVEGNALINGDLRYEATVPAGISLGQLASLGWIVRGNVIVAYSITSTIGAFVLLGQDNVPCEETPTSDPQYPDYNSNVQCGAFFDGNSSQPFTVYGLIVAKAFDFQRTFATVGQGSERIIYDGRVKVNPPPGMEGFIEGLPVTRDSGLQ